MPASILLAALTVANSAGHIGKSRGSCPFQHPVICSPDALQGPVSRDLANDNRVDNKAMGARLGKAGIRMIPLSPGAIRNFALVARSSATTMEMMTLSNRLSRRDGITQMWLTQAAAQRKDLARTIDYFDALLRVYPAEGASLMQQIGASLGQPELRRAMRRFARVDNPWFGAFGSAVLSGERPIRYYGEFLNEADTIPDTAQQRLHYDEVLLRLAREGNQALVGRLYRRLPGADPSALTSVALPGPDDTPYRPVTWWLISNGAIGAEMARGERQLVAYAAPGTSGAMATKLIYLSPGTYRFSWRTVSENVRSGAALAGGAAGTAESFWMIGCAKKNGETLAQSQLESLQGRGEMNELTFDIPRGCPAQSVVLGARLEETASSRQWLISDLSIQPVLPSRQ